MLAEQLGLLEKQIAGVMISKSTMESLRGVSADHEIIIPVGTNAFTKAKLLDPNNMIISVTNNIFIEKNLEDGIKSIDQLLENYKNIQQKIYAQLEDVESKMGQLRPQLEAAYQNMPQQK
jgi:prefoldin alpha subunit